MSTHTGRGPSARRIPRVAFLLGAAWVVLGLAAMRSQAPIRINLGTLAPRGTHYDRSLQALAQEWREISGGSVRLVVYPGGTQGGEADMVRLMRIGALQAGMLTAVGLSDIEPGVHALQSIPMAFRSLEEVDYVIERLRPRLEERFRDEGFEVLFWANAGWVRFFSKTPVIGPDDLMKLKLFAWAGNPDQVEIARRAGFQPVPLETSELVTSIRTPMVSAAAVPPIWALSTQLYISAPHMLDLKWAPLVGATIVSKKIWDRIPERMRGPLREAAHRIGREINRNSLREAEDAVVAMVSRGLVVHEVGAQMEERWREAARSLYSLLRDRVVPGELMDEVLSILREYRAGRDRR